MTGTRDIWMFLETKVALAYEGKTVERIQQRPNKTERQP